VHPSFVPQRGGGSSTFQETFMINTHPSQIRGSRFHGGKFCAAFGVIGLALLGASQVQAGPSANGAVHAVTGMEHANDHATKNCGEGVTVMTPQPGTDLMPIDESNIPPEVDTLYRRAARQHVKWLDTLECEDSSIYHTVGYYSSSWSGYVMGGGSAPSNHYVSTGWYVPTVSVPPNSSSNTNYYSSIWAGLGGGPGSNYNNGAHPLIQAGTDQNVINGQPQYSFWYQILPAPAHPFSMMSVHPGDDVAGGGFWVPGSNTAVVGVCNWNTNECVNINVPGVPEPSNTTEWILEAPSASLSPTDVLPLAAFSPVHFYNGTWAQITTYSTTSQSGIPGSITGQAAPAITGSIINPQPISAAGSSLIYLDACVWNWSNNTCSALLAYPSNLTQNVYGGSDFYVYYN
jgi:hypothetical protein